MVSNPGQASLIGQQLGNYEVRALLGTGATGAVYLAKDLALGRPVALKVLLGSLARNPDQVRRFLLEARAAAPLHHQNIVGVYEAGIRDGVPFIAMEYVEGETLDRFLRRNAPLAWQHALHITAQVACALQCAHDAGIVHRDVKPANILLDRLGCVRLTDFGIAGIQEEQAGARAGSRFFGTPAYMSPEQCGAGAVCSRSDLFSLGVVLYQMLSGALPFAGHTTPALVHAIVNEIPVRLHEFDPSLPDDVVRLAAHLLEKDPEKRPVRAEDVTRTIARLHRENGGASALPEALRAYIRDQAEALCMRADTPLPGERRTLDRPRFRLRQPDKKYEPISLSTRLAMALLLAVSLSGAAYWHWVESPALPEPAPVLMDAAARADADQNIWIDLPGENWLVESMHWVGTDEAVLVVVAGRPGTAVHGSRGLLSVELQSGRVYSLAPPRGPMQDSDIRAAAEWCWSPSVMPAMPARQTLAGLFAVPGIQDSGPDGERALYPQYWNEASPRPVPLAHVQFPGGASLRSGLAETTWSPALHPDGHTLCLDQPDGQSSGRVLFEYDTGTGEGHPISRAIARTPYPVVGGSLQYSPSGAWLAYAVELEPARQELWLARSGAAAPESARPIAMGRLEGAAFSPDETRMAVSVRREASAEVVLVQVETGRIQSVVGPGNCGPESWHPDPDWLVVQAEDEESGESQLWAVSTTPPHGRTRLSRLESGALLPPAVSRDGRWCATASVGDGGPALVFVPWPSGGRP